MLGKSDKSFQMERITLHSFKSQVTHRNWRALSQGALQREGAQVAQRWCWVGSLVPRKSGMIRQQPWAEFQLSVCILFGIRSNTHISDFYIGYTPSGEGLWVSWRISASSALEPVPRRGTFFNSVLSTRAVKSSLAPEKPSVSESRSSRWLLYPSPFSLISSFDLLDDPRKQRGRMVLCRFYNRWGITVGLLQKLDDLAQETVKGMSKLDKDPHHRATMSLRAHYDHLMRLLQV